MSTDLAISLFVHEHLTNPVFSALSIALSKLGDFGIIWIVAAFICLFFKNTRLLGVSIILSLILSLLVTNGVKLLFNRPRPYQDFAMKILISPPRGSSFPSAHTAVSFSGATTYFLLADSKPASYFKWPLMIIAVLTGLSRIYLFVHYTTDVLGGLVIGVLSAFVVVYIMRKLEQSGKLEFLKIYPQSKKKL